MGNQCCSRDRANANYDFSSELSRDLKTEKAGRKLKQLDDFEPSKQMIDYLHEVFDNFEFARDGNGVLKFEVFLEIYRTTLIWNRIEFASMKEELVSERRTALKADDMTLYGEVHQNI